MAIFSLVPVLLIILGSARCAPPQVTCPAPKSPEHGQAFLYQEGSVVKYVCEPGYMLRGKEIVRCVDGEWEDPNPVCIEIGENGIKQELEDTAAEPNVPVPPARPLFSWGTDNEEDNEQEVNSTSEELPLSDEARVRLLMYPRQRARIVTSTVHTGRLQSGTELEDEEKKRYQEETGKKDTSTSTTIHLDPAPSVVYVRRTVTPGKSEAARKALDEQYKTASLHMSVANGHDVELVNLPRAAVSLDDKTQQDEAWRQWYLHSYYNYPRSSSFLDYRTGAPVVMTLTESQLAWINSLHPELRDQYLKDLYVMRAGETVEGDRAMAFLRRYDDAYNYNYNYMYHAPYLRRPMSSIVDNQASTYDHSCNTAGYPVVPAPSIPNMSIARYDGRKNTLEPHNYYLAAVYQCDPGYYPLDWRFSELYCSKGVWVGISPVCVANA